MEVIFLNLFKAFSIAIHKSRFPVGILQIIRHIIGFSVCIPCSTFTNLAEIVREVWNGGRTAVDVKRRCSNTGFIVLHGEVLSI